ncbi:DUF4399 domain-containing protein [Kordiimonas lacus]|uniref:DUF4399 domain-containing protein n=1 Tax=Kordiimonas lacus TaxID=637679 RepID=A0A1G6WQN7_9PROT|nr:DUF4399 domain-containing protein [Kordiimonas lacus]SDD68099.1 protein of unknown function [Kordiimonas lacus]
MTIRAFTAAVGLAFTVAAAPSAMAFGHADNHAEVYIISPIDGAEVSSPVTVVFGLKGMGVAPAGTDKANTGHHHLLIDTVLPPLDENIPADENHVHFGGGQTEVTLDLKPGTHTLQLLLGDMNHIPHDPAVYSKKITVTVKE